MPYSKVISYWKVSEWRALSLSHFSRPFSERSVDWVAQFHPVRYEWNIFNETLITYTRTCMRNQKNSNSWLSLLDISFDRFYNTYIMSIMTFPIDVVGKRGRCYQSGTTAKSFHKMGGGFRGDTNGKNSSREVARFPRSSATHVRGKWYEYISYTPV